MAPRAGFDQRGILCCWWLTGDPFCGLIHEQLQGAMEKCRAAESRVSSQVSPAACGGRASGVPGAERACGPAWEGMKGSREGGCWSRSLPLGSLAAPLSRHPSFPRSRRGPQALPICPRAGAPGLPGLCCGPEGRAVRLL